MAYLVAAVTVGGGLLVAFHRFLGPAAELLALVPLMLVATHIIGRARHRMAESEARLAALSTSSEQTIGALADALDEQKRIRAEADASHQRTAFLDEASRVLASSLEYEATLKRVAELAVPHLCDVCTVDVLDEDGTLRRLAVTHAAPVRAESFSKLTEGDAHDGQDAIGVTAVLRHGRSQLHRELADVGLAVSGGDAERLRRWRNQGLRSVMMVPLAVRQQILGVLTFAIAASPRRYESADLALAEELARRAATAVENARLYRQTEQGQWRSKFLAEASAVLSSSLNYRITLGKVARLAVPALGSRCVVYVERGDGGVDRVAAAHAESLDQGLAAGIEAFPPGARLVNSDLARQIMSGSPVLLPYVPESMLEAIAESPEHFEVLKRLQFRSLMAVPVRGHGRVFGALAFLSTDPARVYRTSDVELASDLAMRAALSIENARLYEAASEANRLKDEFLATLSHELRTPLNAILGWAHMLRTGKVSPSSLDRALASIERNAQAQAHLVADILDVSRIISGKLPFNAAAVQLRPSIEAALDAVRPAALAKGIELKSELDPSAVDIIGDADRLQQVFWNLLSNAVKFTGNGGRVEISATRAPSHVVATVADTGIGIGDEFLPYVFDRFRQGDASSTRHHGGLGLGLAIARHLVELHGGTVKASSTGQGQGATFTVELPLPPAHVHQTNPEAASP